MNRVQLSTEYFPNPVASKALSNANIYVGLPDTDPEVVANRKTVSALQENGSIVAITQPVKTGLGGIPVYNGSPVTLLVDGQYSVKVTSSTGTQLYYVPVNYQADDSPVVKYVSDIASLRTTQAEAGDGETIYLVCHTSNGDGGHGTFYWDASSTAADDNGVTIAVTGVATGRWVRQLNGFVTPEMFGGDINSITSSAYTNTHLLADTYTLSADLNLSLLNPGYLIEGSGDYTIIACGSHSVLSNYVSGAWNDHKHAKITGLRFRGDGSQVLLDTTNMHYSSVDNCVFDGGDTGRKLTTSYTANATKNHYKSNRIGLHLNAVTSYVEKDIYARSNTEAAVYISGKCENIKLLGGAIEGNHGCAIKVANDVVAYLRLLIEDIYFELDGDQSAGTPSIDIPDIEGVVVTVRGGKLSYNVVGAWISGDYNLGNSVVFDGTRLDGYVNSKNISFGGGVDLGGATFNHAAEPPMVSKFESSCTFSAGRAGTRGYVFACPLSGRSTAAASPYVNTGKVATPYAAVLSAGPTIASEATLDYGDGDWSAVQFGPVAGSYEANSVYIGNTFTGTTNVRIHSFLMQSDTDTEIEILESGDGASILARHTLKAGVTYKMCCFTNKTITGTQRLAVYPIGTDAPKISFLCLGQWAADDVPNGSVIVSKVVSGAI